MDRKFGGVRYTSERLESREEGWVAFQLNLHDGDRKRGVARICYWDASGGFFVEGISEEIPLTVLEDLIGEARSEIRAP